MNIPRVLNTRTCILVTVSWVASFVPQAYMGIVQILSFWFISFVHCWIFLCVSLRVYSGPKIYLSVSVCLSVCVYLSVCLPVCLKVRVCLSIRLLACLCLCLTNLFVFVCLSACLSVSKYLSVRLLACLTTCVCPSAFLSVSLSACLSVHLSAFRCLSTGRGVMFLQIFLLDEILSL